MVTWIVGVVAGLYGIFSLVIYLGQEKVIFFPEKLEAGLQFDFPGNWEEVSVSVEKDVTLNAIWFKAQEPKGVVLYFHGNAGSVRNWGNMAPPFVERGFDCFMPDYRGYGKSTGELSEAGLYADAEACYAYVKEHYPESQIIICGRSLGTGIAAYLASKHNPAKLLLETPYYSFKDMAKLHFRFFPVESLLRYHFRTGYWMDKITCPVVAVHGTKDELIPVTQSKKLRQHFGSKDSLVLLEGVHHNDIQEFAAYERYLNQYLTL